MKILYGVAGEGGMGHAVRSLPIIKHLKKHHDVKIIAGGTSATILKKHYKIEDVVAFKLLYKNNRINEFRLVFDFCTHFFSLRKKNLAKVTKIVSDFKPDVIVSDAELLSTGTARRNKIPYIEIDNVSILAKCKMKPGLRHYKNYFFSKNVIESVTRNADYYLIPTFFNIPVKANNVFLVPPVLRDEILKLKTKDLGYFLVYQTSDSNKELLSVLKKVNSKFIVYGFNQEKMDANLIFKKFNETVFFKDLSNCSGVIANGGFTLISESLHLKKPILSIPVENLYEQTLNAMQLDRLGYGMYCKRINVEHLKSFIKQIPKFKKNLSRYKKEDNTKLFSLLDKFLAKLNK